MAPPAAGGFPTIPCGGGSTSASATNTLPEPCAAGCSATVSPQPSTTRIRAPQASAQPSTAHSLAPQAAACESAACEPLSQATARAAGLTRSLARCGRACLGAHALPCAQRSRAGRRGGPISDVGPPRRLHGPCVVCVAGRRYQRGTNAARSTSGAQRCAAVAARCPCLRAMVIVSARVVSRRVRARVLFLR